MIDEKTAQQAKELLGELKDPVKFITFTSESECMYCPQTVELIQDITKFSGKISHEIHDIDKDKDLDEKYGIDKVPAIVILGNGKDYGIRFYGIPSGYEFVSLLESIKMLSTGEHGLNPKTVEKLNSIKKPIHIQVFITPTCPYCPRSVMLAHKFSYVSDKIRGDMVEAIEFPDLSNRFNVMGVPRSVFNDEDFIEGAVPEKVFADKTIEVANR